MGTIFQKIDEEKIETIEQIVKISDLRQIQCHSVKHHFSGFLS